MKNTQVNGDAETTLNDKRKRKTKGKRASEPP
jgi:hypothetical protein